MRRICAAAIAAASLLFIGVALPADSATAATPFQQWQRINSLTLEFGTDNFASNNAFGGAFPAAGQSSVQNAVTSQVNAGVLSMLFDFPGLADLTGMNVPSLTVGVDGANPFSDLAQPNPYNGSSDLDWWYTPKATGIGPGGVPVQTLTGAITAGALAAAGTGLTMNPSPFGAGTLDLSSVAMSAMVGSSSTPLVSHDNFPPGHLPSEKVPKTLTSFASMSGGHLAGNISAASLASIPIPSFLTSCSEGYTSSNSLLDVLVLGCHESFVTVVAPTQPDTVNANAPAAGAGPPYHLVTAPALRSVTACADKSKAPIPLATCLQAAAYSAYFQFTTDRVIAPPPPRITVTPRKGPPGTEIVVTGTGFHPSASVNVVWQTGLITGPRKLTFCSALTVDPSGMFLCDVQIPLANSGGLGGHEITATEGPGGDTAATTFRLTLPH
jgi:hypothetical protein